MGLVTTIFANNFKLNGYEIKSLRESLNVKRTLHIARWFVKYDLEKTEIYGNHKFRHYGENALLFGCPG